MSKNKVGQVQIYTGNGKGKTTAALGLCLRASGHGLRICFIQFMKSGEYGELKALKKFPKVIIKQFGLPGLIKVGQAKPQDWKLADQALQYAKKAINSQKYDLIVLDEIIVAIYFKLIAESKVIKIIKEKPKGLELVLTGRKCSAKVINTADLVSEVKEIKHYYKSGLKARSGIEY